VTDIATLGLAIDSRQATQAKTALDALAASSKPAAAGFTAIEVAAARAAQGEAKAATQAGMLAKQTGLARHEMVNLGRPAPINWDEWHRQNPRPSQRQIRLASKRTVRIH
jgi:hypothetical protein